jgi:hypothetical protein
MHYTARPLTPTLSHSMGEGEAPHPDPLPFGRGEEKHRRTGMQPMPETTE